MNRNSMVLAVLAGLVVLALGLSLFSTQAEKENVSRDDLSGDVAPGYVAPGHAQLHATQPRHPDRVSASESIRQSRSDARVELSVFLISVQDVGGKPIPGASVFALHGRGRVVQPSHVSFLGQSGEDGLLQPEQQALRAARERSGRMIVRAEGFAQQVVEIPEKDRKVDVVLRVAERFEVCVVTRDGMPVKDCVVSLSRWGHDGAGLGTRAVGLPSAGDTRPIYHEITGARGVAEFRTLLRGRYFIHLNPRKPGLFWCPSEFDSIVQEGLQVPGPTLRIVLDVPSGVAMRFEGDEVVTSRVTFSNPGNIELRTVGPQVKEFQETLAKAVGGNGIACACCLRDAETPVEAEVEVVFKHSGNKRFRRVLSPVIHANESIETITIDPAGSQRHTGSLVVRIFDSRNQPVDVRLAVSRKTLRKAGRVALRRAEPKELAPGEYSLSVPRDEPFLRDAISKALLGKFGSSRIKIRPGEDQRIELRLPVPLRRCRLRFSARDGEIYLLRFKSSDRRPSRFVIRAKPGVEFWVPHGEHSFEVLSADMHAARKGRQGVYRSRGKHDLSVRAGDGALEKVVDLH